MSNNTLVNLCDGLRASFDGMDNADLEKTARVEHFREAQDTIRKIDNALRFSKGVDSSQFSFATILQMSKQPALSEDVEDTFRQQFDDLCESVFESWDDEELNAIFAERFGNVYEDIVKNVFENVFENLGDEEVEAILAGRFDNIEKPEEKIGMPAIIDGEEVSDNVEGENISPEQKRAKRIEERIEKTFVRMGSDNQTEAEASYRQAFGLMKKANQAEREAGNSDYSISFRKILDASQFEARIAANIKRSKIDNPVRTNDAEASHSTALCAVPEKASGSRSLSQVAVTPAPAIREGGSYSETLSLDRVNQVHENMVDLSNAFRTAVHSRSKPEFGHAEAVSIDEVRARMFANSYDRD